MKSLIIDTATSLMYVGLVDGDNLIDKRTRISKKDISKYLVSEIKGLLESNDVTLDEIDRIIVGKGPGSYTGLRIAGTVSKTLCYAKGIDLYEVSSLFLLTSGYDKAISMIDARNNNVFGAIYDGGVARVADGHWVKGELLAKQKNEEIVLIDETNYMVDVRKVIKVAKKVSNTHEYIPNYINKTEAERNNENK